MNQHSAWSLLITLSVTYAIGLGTGFALHWALNNTTTPPAQSDAVQSADAAGEPEPSQADATGEQPTREEPAADRQQTAQSRSSEPAATPRNPQNAGGGQPSSQVARQPEPTPEEQSGLDPSLWVAHHFFVAINGTTLDEPTRQFLREVRPGGVVLRDVNLRSRPQTQALVDEIKEAVNLGGGVADLPLIAVAQEGGRFNVLALAEAPSAVELGRAGDETLARDTGLAYAQACLARGIGVVLAPVLDVYEPDTVFPSLASRSFGADQTTVATMGLAFADGLRQGGVIPVVKHFPGSGGATYASDGVSVVLQKDIGNLAFTMYPFNEAAKRQVAGMLVGHIAVPVLDKGDPHRPASLSPIMIQKLLREQWQYRGVVLSEDLAYNPMIDVVGTEEAAVRALLAGCDAVLFLDPNADRILKVCRAVEKAVEEGRVPLKTLNESKHRLREWQRMLRAADVQSQMGTPRYHAADRQPIPPLAEMPTSPEEVPLNSESVQIQGSTGPETGGPSESQQATPAEVSPEPSQPEPPTNPDEEGATPDEPKTPTVRTPDKDPTATVDQPGIDKQTESESAGVINTDATLSESQPTVPATSQVAARETPGEPVATEPESAESDSPDTAQETEQASTEEAEPTQEEGLPPESIATVPEDTESEAQMESPDAESTDDTGNQVAGDGTVASAPEPSTGDEVGFQYEVVEDDTLESIAQRFEIAANDITIWNELGDSPLEPGQQLQLYLSVEGETPGEPSDAPVAGESTTEQVEEEPPKPETELIEHKVAWGDTLSSISRYYGVTVANIMEWNNLESTGLREGQVLEVFAPVEDKTDGVRNYTVQAGDTLSSISVQFETTQQQLMTLNGITNPNQLFVGQRIKVPAPEELAPSTP